VLRPSRVEIVVLLVLFGIAALLQGHFPFVGGLPVAGALVLGVLRLWKRLPALVNAERVSTTTSLWLSAWFLLALVPAGHGVLPVAVFLFAGWERFPEGTLLAWLALACLGASAVLRARLATTLSWIGSVLALAAWGLLEAHADDVLAGVVASLPFLGCLVLHAIHLARLRPAPRPAEG